MVPTPECQFTPGRPSWRPHSERWTGLRSVDGLSPIAGTVRAAEEQSDDEEEPVDTVTSKDGTSIAFDRLGNGPPVVLVCGGSVDRMADAGLAAALASDLTVYNFDRRGRGDSGDAPEYAVAREVEDIAAMIDAAGGSAHLYGTSSGAALAMEAAASGLPIRKLALWEPPYSVQGRPDLPDDTASVYRELVAAGRRGDAVEYFMLKVVGMPEEFAAAARQAPWWKDQEAIAHTLAYDATVMGDYTIPTERARAVSVPTIILVGGASFGFMGETADALAELIPNAHRRTLEGQEHNVDPEVMAQALKQFFAS
jgi:pimeloyl-ACP methyl ester carboxylesterase